MPHKSMISQVILLVALLTSVLSTAAIPSPVQAWGKAPVQIEDKIGAAFYNHLQQQAQENGRVRLIVKLDVPFNPQEMALGGAQALDQQSGIAVAQNQVESALAGLEAEVLYNYEYIPYNLVNVNENALDVLLSLPFVVSVEEDKISKADLSGSIPLINADDAWSNCYTGSGQTVAILDTGVDKNHPFLAGKVISEACYSDTYTGWPASNSVCPGGAEESIAVNSAMPYAGICPSGECDHGTHVAGIAAGVGTSFSGVAKNASIIAIQVFSRFDNYPDAGCTPSTPCALSWDSDQLKGLQRVYALRSTYNIAAVNMSIGGGGYTSNCDGDSRKAQIDLLRAAGIATVISSGNNGYTNAISSPACISSAISVGATDKSDVVASYSNSASFLKLLAPGSAITSSLPGTGYATWNGTSMAAPHVTGAWAVIKSKAPNASVDEILNALINTGRSVTDSRNGIAKPRIDVKAALDTFISSGPSICATIGGDLKGGYLMVPPTSQAIQYALDGGPVVIQSNNGTDIVASLNQWRRPTTTGGWTGVTQSMALPIELISNKYVIPRYDDFNDKTLYQAVLMANVDTVSRNITVTIGGTTMGTYTLGPSESRYEVYNIVGGPIVVSSVEGAKIVASLYELKRAGDTGQWNGQSEMMGVPQSMLSDRYLIPIYFGNWPTYLDASIVFANADTRSTTIEVYIGGELQGSYPMPPNTSQVVRYALDGGPVLIQSNDGAKIVASLNQWRRPTTTGGWTGVTQSMALQYELISNKYFIPRYDDFNDKPIYQAVLMANVDTVSRDITVKIGSTTMGTYTLGPSESRYEVYDIVGGPIVVSAVEGAKIVASLYELKRAGDTGQWNGQSEMMGVPELLLSDTYLIPIYFGNWPTYLDASINIGVPQ